MARLRTALCGPLGALGDQLFWAGEVAGALGAGAGGGRHGLGAWAVLAAVVMHNVLRIGSTAWGLDLGAARRPRRGSALDRSWLPRGAERAQRAAGFCVGLAVPVVAWRLLAGSSHMLVVGTIVASGVASVLTPVPHPCLRAALRMGLVIARRRRHRDGVML